MATTTPWGKSQSKTKYARGINFYSCAGHGGIILSAGMNKRIPEYARDLTRAYEEDCDWSIVVTFLPEYFNEKMQNDAKSTLMNWHPDIYERHYGVVIPNGQSYVKDRARMRAANANRFVVTTAWGAWHESVPTGKVGVNAVKEATGERKSFLIDDFEYNSRNSGDFIINEDIHSLWEASV